MKTILTALVFGFSIALASAQTQPATLKHDVTVDPAHGVTLKAGQQVQIMWQSNGKDVVQVMMPDGSSGTYQVDATQVALDSATSPAPATASPSSAGSAPSSQPAATAPVYPKNFVGAATAETTAGNKGGGTACLVHLKNQQQTYILSVRHLLGPEAGFATQTAAKDVPTFVQAIDIDPLAAGATHEHFTVTPLAVPTERLEPKGNLPMDDMAIYSNQDPSEQDQAQPLSDERPQLHEQLWLIAKVSGGVPEDQAVQPVHVDHFNMGWIYVQFDNDQIQPGGASGAPVLNAAGEVVGIYSGHHSDGGHIYGLIIPAPLIANVIKNAPQN